MSYTTPNSIIKLYKVPFNPDLNGYIDDLEVYLGSLEDLDDSDYFAKYEIQYQKHALDLTVKIRTSESQQLTYDYNYCSIQNVIDSNGTKEERCYYFINNLVVKSSDALELTLHLDTVNTLGQGATSKCNPRNFLATTYIKRQHKDRFKKKLDHVPGTSVTLLREIDAVDEGIVPDKIKQSDTKLNTSEDLDWYLIYNTDSTDPNTPVKTYLCASEALSLGTYIAATTEITPGDLTDGDYYYILNSISPNTYLILTHADNTTTTLRLGYSSAYSGSYAPHGAYMFNYQSWSAPGHSGYIYQYGPMTGMVYYKYGGNMVVKALCSSTGATTAGYDATYNPPIFSDIIKISVQEADKCKVCTALYGTVEAEAAAGTIETYNVASRKIVASIDMLDRTQSTLVKVIKYPYCPINYEYNSTADIYTFDDSWQWDTRNKLFLQYVGAGLPVLGNDKILSLDMSDYVKLSIPAATQTDNADKNIDAESKLFNSAFKTVKLTYDSFSLPIFWENYNLYPYGIADTTLTVDFKPTATINSSFGFKLNTEPLGVYQTVEDYGRYLLITRNNEEVIYNDEYINYIKNGYNYDKKANALSLEQAQRSATASTVGTVLSTIGSIAALAAAPFTGGVSVAAAIPMIAGSVTGGISAANAWKNVSNLVENQENTMAAKLAQLKAQAASASGSDDVDLMSWYCDNRLHLIHYQPKLEWRQALYRAFDYTGYAYKRYGTPSVDTRIWYNFLQCSPMIEYEGSRKARTVWLEDLKNRYESGVTVFHNRNGRWNFTRQYENWEKWIIDAS